MIRTVAKPSGSAGEAKRGPDLDRAQDPACQVQDEPAPQDRLPPIDLGEGHVNRRRSGSRSLRPTSAKEVREPVEKREAMPLDDDECKRKQAGGGQADSDRERGRHIGPDTEEQNEADRHIGDLGDELEGEVDKGAGRGHRSQKPRQASRRAPPERSRPFARRAALRRRHRESSRPHKKIQAGLPGTRSRHASPSSDMTERWIKQITAKPSQPIARKERTTLPAPK